MTDLDATGDLPLRHFIEPLQSAEEFRLSVGDDASGHELLTALPRTVIDTWMAEVAHDHPDMDAKTRAAYLIGDIAWAFGTNLGAMHLTQPGLPDVSADALAAAPQWYRWEHEGESGDALRFTLRILASPEARHRSLDVDGVRALAIAAHTPLIEALFGITRLGRSAMWRLVADAVAAGWLYAGKALNREADAMALADAIIQHQESPLANKQTGFIEIVVRDEKAPEQVAACEWFRARGGCCRYYTTEKSAGEYCTTCVLRPTESRDQRLYDYVKGKLDVPA